MRLVDLSSFEAAVRARTRLMDGPRFRAAVKASLLAIAPRTAATPEHFFTLPEHGTDPFDPGEVARQVADAAHLPLSVAIDVVEAVRAELVVLGDLRPGETAADVSSVPVQEPGVTPTAEVGQPSSASDD